MDLVVGPSGYGLPWPDVRDLGPEELELLVLADAADGPRGTIVGGMGRVLQALKESGLPVCFAPGVLQLATVPEHRKANRIDMGTADKLCAVALAVWDQARRLDVGYDETSFVSVEVGGAFTAVVAVERGAIIDGAGGTSGAMGFRRAGRHGRRAGIPAQGILKGRPCERGSGLDRRDSRLFARGACARRGERASRLGRPDCAARGQVTKAVAAESILLEAPREILLSGRLVRVPELASPTGRRAGAGSPRSEWQKAMRGSAARLRKAPRCSARDWPVTAA